MLWGRISKGRILTQLLFLVVVVLLGWQVVSHGLLLLGILGQSPRITIPAFSKETGFRTPSISLLQVPDTPTPTLLGTVTPTFMIQTFAPTIVAPHALETPIGIEYKLVIHRVVARESLMSIASQYWTTVDAIQAANYYLPNPLQIDWLIIVPINQTDVYGLPVLDAYEVKTDIAVRTLAQQLSIDPALLELYNGLGNNEFLSSGEWVLVPHLGTATP